MSRIFISYSHADRVFAQRLYSDLAGLHADLWMDEDRIRAGDNWRKEIDTALATCDTMLLIVSPESMSSMVVRMEYQYFLDHADSKTLIPIQHRLAEVPLVIQRLHYVDFRTPIYVGPFMQLHRELVRLGHSIDPLPPSLNASVHIPGQQRLLPLDVTSMIRVARYDLFISGIALDSVVPTHFDLLREKLNDSVRLWMMTIALEPDVLNTTARWLGRFPGRQTETERRDDQHVTWFKECGMYDQLTSDGLHLGIRVRRTLRKVCELTQEHPFSEKFEVRTFHERPSFGYLIIDPERREAQLTAAPYVFHLEPTEYEPPGPHRTPHLVYLAGLTHDETERMWFKRYLDDFKRQWWQGASPLDCAALGLI